MKNKTNTLWVLILTVLSFVLLAFAVETFSGSSTEKFEVMLQDGTRTDVIVITSKTYDEVEWDHIKKVVVIEARHTSSSDYLSGRSTTLLKDEGYDIVAVGIQKRVTTFTIPPKE